MHAIWFWQTFLKLGGSPGTQGGEVILAKTIRDFFGIKIVPASAQDVGFGLTEQTDYLSIHQHEIPIDVLYINERSRVIGDALQHRLGLDQFCRDRKSVV